MGGAADAALCEPTVETSESQVRSETRLRGQSPWVGPNQSQSYLRPDSSSGIGPRKSAAADRPDAVDMRNGLRNDRPQLVRQENEWNTHHGLMLGVLVIAFIADQGHVIVFSCG